MNPVTWARTIIRPLIEDGPKEGKALTGGLIAHAGEPCESCGVPSHFKNENVRFWHFSVLARDAERSLKENGERTTAAIRRATQAPLHEPVKQLNVAAFRDVLRHCREQIAFYSKKGEKFLAAAARKGYKQLRLEFKEFTSGNGNGAKS